MKSLRQILAYGLFAVVAVGCRGRDGRVEVRAELGPDQPLTDLEVAFLPFDAEALRDSLSTQATTPRPSFTELTTELLEYRPGDGKHLTTLMAPLNAFRDTVATLSDSLLRLDPNSRAYRTLYARFRRQYIELMRRGAERDATMRELYASDYALAERASRAADSLRAWEGVALARYPELADSAVAQSGLEPIRVTTDSAGRTHVNLKRGPWWLTARLRHPDNPFLEYYWSVGLVVTGRFPVVVPLSPINVEERWRY